MQRFRGGLVFKAHRLCVSLNSRLESNKEEEEVTDCERSRYLVVHDSSVPIKSISLQLVRVETICAVSEVELVSDDLTLFLVRKTSKLPNLIS